MKNDKDHHTMKKDYDEAGPAPENNNDDDEDLIALRLGPSIRSAPTPPKPDPDFGSSMHGLVRDQPSHLASSSVSFHPYTRPCPQNPNANLPSPSSVPDFSLQVQNPNPNLPSPSSIPDFSLQVQNPNPNLPSPSSVPNFGLQVQNPNPNLPSQSSLPDFSALFQVQNPNPSFLTSLETIPPMPNPNHPNPSYGPIRKQRNSANRGLRAGKSKTVAAMYPWATNRRARVHTLEHLAAIGIQTVTGEVQCRRCEKRFEVGYDLRSEFSRLRDFIAEKKETLKHRSAPEWDNPMLLDCKQCHAREAAKAVVAEKKREINWLFLLLGGFLCCCTLEQLKYFCKHTGNHRTGAKNRVLYLTYLGLCKQLDPSGPFDALCD